MADSTNELEYHLKFAQSSPKDNTQGKENDDPAFFYNNEKLPVVILFGWAGCKDKYLAKYSEIYEDKGCITLRCTLPTIVIFFRQDKLKKLGQKILDVLHETSLDEHPIFFHVFSNGGAFFYQSVSLIMQNKKTDLEVKGVIFDSSPGKRRFYSVYGALSAIIGGSPWYNIPVALILTLFVFLAFAAFAFGKAIIEFQRLQTDPIVLVDEPFTWPQLFIYSKDDELVKSKDIEEFASIREKKGVTIRKLCFENSPHVKHLLTHRELYISTIFQFLQECLQDKDKDKYKP